MKTQFNTICLIIALWIFSIAVVMSFISNYVDKLERKCSDAIAKAEQWEQLYRDCQAAQQFSEPAHAADAVNDVTR